MTRGKNKLKEGSVLLNVYSMPGIVLILFKCSSHLNLTTIYKEGIIIIILKVGKTVSQK